MVRVARMRLKKSKKKTLLRLCRKFHLLARMALAASANTIATIGVTQGLNCNRVAINCSEASSNARLCVAVSRW